jgi:ElaB/YqjD/DUF883 family membrane-anchored ribosome-binding protein
MEQATSFIPGQSSTNQGPNPAQLQDEAQAHSAGQYLDKALNLIGAKMRAAANIVKERAPREDSLAKSALERVSSALDSTGQYMIQEEVTQNLRGVVRRHPLRSLGVCLIAGLALGSLVRAARR